ncbi:YbhB/YbcL family Raf kinase inhibitor-like protein [Streptococcus dentiloxodontae]
MKISVAFKDNIIPDKYAKKAEQVVQGLATISFPFQLTGLPKETKSLAWTLVDYDSIPVCGFAYIHWIVANVSPDKTDIEENFSQTDEHHLRGVNSLVSRFLSEDYSQIDHYYIGPKPPDKDHVYTLEVYALDSLLDLEEGYYLNELQKAIKPHLLDTARIELIGKY